MPRVRLYDVMITFFVTAIVGVTFWYGQHLNTIADHDQQRNIDDIKLFLVDELDKRDAAKSEGE